jgi:hypothetical protein
MRRFVIIGRGARRSFEALYFQRLSIGINSLTLTGPLKHTTAKVLVCRA